MKNCRSKKLTLNRYHEYMNIHVFKTTGMLNGFLAKQKWFHGLPFGKTKDGDSRVLATTHFHAYSESKKLGDIYFSLENISIDTISHESVHFAAGLMLLKKIESISIKESGENQEEQFASLIGQTAQHIADYLYSLI